MATPRGSKPMFDLHYRLYKAKHVSDVMVPQRAMTPETYMFEKVWDRSYYDALMSGMTNEDACRTAHEAMAKAKATHEQRKRIKN